VICPPCTEAMGRWLDARPPAVGGFSFGSGAAYDISPAGVTERRRARGRWWAGIVRAQRQTLAEACRAGRHVGVDTSQS
jgi:hypothetical protein